MKNLKRNTVVLLAVITDYSVQYFLLPTTVPLFESCEYYTYMATKFPQAFSIKTVFSFLMESLQGLAVWTEAGFTKVFPML